MTDDVAQRLAKEWATALLPSIDSLDGVHPAYFEVLALRLVRRERTEAVREVPADILEQAIVNRLWALQRERQSGRRVS
ncbi:MAG: hypothetical protein NZM12_01165 [Steroidobacteraceae bacterium]|nr:hypothetical protein [Steroidobacteraceae bacterium]MDW8258760.1 hypothetical protein [Gammaproteobacteria bacterium]